MNIRNFVLIMFALVATLSATAQKKHEVVEEELALPHKVENVTIKDLYGDPATLPHWGEKNLLIFYVDPDAYLAMSKNNKFAEELEENCRAAGPEIYGFGIMNFPDTWLPKDLLRKICYKRTEKNGAIIIDDDKHLFKNAWNLGNCNGKFLLILVDKQGIVRYIRREPMDAECKKEFYEMIVNYTHA